MKRLKFVFYYLYSIFFCLRYLPFSQARRVPILIHPSAKVRDMGRGRFILNGRIWHSMIVIGFEGSMGRCNKDTVIYIKKGSHVVFNGYARLAKGCHLIINKGNVEFGSKVRFNGDCFFSCYDEMKFGDDLMCGWNVSFLTTNGHIIMVDGVEKETISPIVIGNHVWLGSDSVINKGVVIPDGCVCAHHSIVTKSFDEENSLYGGFPAKKLRSNVTWKP